MKDVGQTVNPEKGGRNRLLYMNVDVVQYSTDINKYIVRKGRDIKHNYNRI